MRVSYSRMSSEALERDAFSNGGTIGMKTETRGEDEEVSQEERSGVRWEEHN